MCASIQIKNSGIYFVALSCILFGVSFKYDKNNIKQKLFTIFVPFISLFLWHAHCSYLFSDSSVSKHAMTIKNYGQVLSNKDGNDVKLILTNVLKFAITGKRLYEIVLFIAILGALLVLCKIQVRKTYFKLVFLSVFMYVTYMIGTACMYLFSMPGEEAKNLSDINRYRNSIFIAIYYLIVLFSIQILSSIEDKKKKWIYLSGIYLALFVIWRGEQGGGKVPVIFNNYIDGTRTRVEQTIKENNVPESASYLICVPERSAGYIYHMCRYILWSCDISPRTITEKPQLEDSGNYEYILIFDGENQVVQDWVKENYPEQEGKSVISTAKHNE